MSAQRIPVGGEHEAALTLHLAGQGLQLLPDLKRTVAGFQPGRFLRALAGNRLLAFGFWRCHFCPLLRLCYSPGACVRVNTARPPMVIVPVRAAPVVFWSAR